MKRTVLLFITIILISSCSQKETESKKKTSPDQNAIEGSWKMIYADIKENDSVQVKDLSNTDFIKIINKSHFAFFNQDRGSEENFFAGGGTYELNGDQYSETLDFINSEAYRGHVFTFNVEINGDTLIQHGKETIEEANIDRYILEKYIRIKPAH